MVLTNEDFKNKVLEWTTEQNKVSRAIWNICDSDPSSTVIIDARQYINLDKGLYQLCLDLHCTCTTKDEINSIRSAVEDINDGMFDLVDKQIDQKL